MKHRGTIFMDGIDSYYQLMDYFKNFHSSESNPKEEIDLIEVEEREFEVVEDEDDK